jgi:hypothetical protein
MSKLKDTKVYSINDFWDWNERGELELSPKYQRKAVWNSKAESYLIDTIIRGLPIPQVFVRQTIDPIIKKTRREVIDGQQRLRTIIKFIKNEFPIMKQHNTEFGGMTYSELDTDVQSQFLSYQLPVELITTDDESLIYDMFVRVNTNSYVLNRQELRNARFWGDFKVLVYKLASEWRNFFQENKTFTDAEFLRMKDAEFVSSLLILIKDGIKTDTPKNIDEYYKKNEILTNYDELFDTFTESMKTIKDIFDDHLFSTKVFNKSNYIYTLLAFILSMKGKLIFDLGLDNDLSQINIKNQLTKVESLVSIDEENISEAGRELAELHKARTTNEIERKRRVKLFAKLMHETN